MQKKLLAVLLSILMLVSAFPFAILADEDVAAEEVVAEAPADTAEAPAAEEEAAAETEEPEETFTPLEVTFETVEIDGVTY